MVVGRGAQWLSEQLELAAKERRARESQDKVPEDPHLIWDEELAQQLQVEEDQQAASHAASLDSEGQLVLKVRLARLCLRVRVLPFLQAHLKTFSTAAGRGARPAAAGRGRAASSSTCCCDGC